MKKILIVQGIFYPDISQLLLKGTSTKLEKLGYCYEVIDVYGALEIPTVISLVSKSDRAREFAGYIALGCVIRGETSHYEIVCNESARALTQISIDHNLAIANGILTVENHQQALIRANPIHKDKGGFCAMACHQLILIKNNFKIL